MQGCRGTSSDPERGSGAEFDSINVITYIGSLRGIVWHRRWVVLPRDEVSIRQFHQNRSSGTVQTPVSHSRVHLVDRRF